MDAESLKEKWTLCPVTEQKIWNPGLLSIRIATGVRRHRHGQFVRIALLAGDDLLSRPYSLVSRHEDPVSEIIYNIVPAGALTPRLCKLGAGDEIYVSKMNYGSFVLEEVPETGKHLWCCGTGTGIGPYIPMIQSGQIWERFEQVILLHGVRHDQDLAYRDLILGEVRRRAGRLHYHPVVSRDREFDGLRGRVTHVIADGRAEELCGVKISAEQSQFMLCGNAAFIDDLRNLLLTRGLKKNLRREPGNITVERYWG